MQTEELFSKIEDKLEDHYYNKKTFMLIKKIYGEINDAKINDVKKSNKIILPFYGHIVTGKCYGIQKNYNLYTQCTRSKQKDNEYCKICIKQSLQTETNKPIYGDIRDRKKTVDRRIAMETKRSFERSSVYICD